MFCIPPNTDWPISDADYQKMTPEIRERAEILAWTNLATLCAYRIGVCPTEVRPCAAGCMPGGSWMAAPVTGAHMAALPLLTIGSFTPHIVGGNAVNGCGCRGAGDCGCSALSEVILPGPVGGIESVKIDGVAVPPEKYRVDDGDRLVSLDPNLKWPVCQDMAAGVDEVGSFVVSYYRGSPPNPLTRYAAGVLAKEWYAALTGMKCRLPSNVTQVVRQGVTVTLRAEMFEGGITNIPEVDSVVNAYNPYHLKTAPRVLSPDGPRAARRTTWSH